MIGDYCKYGVQLKIKNGVYMVGPCVQKNGVFIVNKWFYFLLYILNDFIIKNVKCF